ncbi:MAG: SsrA-binding protein SmpB [Endomicrobiales bacterium]|nr:SsrA-binding protein SmpB [Endomicrobiales bacterium]
MNTKIVTTNRKAFHDYSILEKYEAGLVLAGYEIKSLRVNGANLTDGFVNFKGGEAFLGNVHIPPYVQQSTHVKDYDPRRERKLLMHKSEIAKLFARTREKGLALVPLQVYFSRRGIAKVELGLGKGKKTYSKKATIKRRDIERETDQELKFKKRMI